MTVLNVTPKPLLRGWSHAVATIPAFAGALVLVASAGTDGALRISLIVYGATLVMLFAVSATYHLAPWSPEWKARWRRLDQATIFTVIAGTYTPVVAKVLDGWSRPAILAAIWALSAAGVVLVTSPLRLNRPRIVLAYVAMGWVALAVLPELATRVGPSAVSLLIAGGFVYSLGAIVYVLQRPQLWPRVFGYHELFHLLVIAATAMFFVFIATDVVAGTAR